jgi:hypothetical protein
MWTVERPAGALFRGVNDFFVASRPAHNDVGCAAFKRHIAMVTGRS